MTGTIEVNGGSRIFGYLIIRDGRTEFVPIGARDGDDTWLRVKEAAEVARRSQSRIYQLCEEERLVSRRHFGELQIALSSIDRILRAPCTAV